MRESTTYDEVYHLLVSLCERQEELSTAAHLRVMEAFNTFMEATYATPMVGPTVPGPLAELLQQSRVGLRELSDRAPDLPRAVMYTHAEEQLRAAVGELG